MLETIIDKIPCKGYFKLDNGTEVEYCIEGKNITFKRQKDANCRLSLGITLSKIVILEFKKAVELKNTALFRELC